jgi:hypothetical protein
MPMQPAVSTSVPPPGFEPPPTYAPTPSADAAPVLPRVRTGVPMRSRLLVGGLALAAAVAAVFVLLGSTNSQVTDPVAQAATLSSNSPGYRLNLRMTMTAPTLTQPVVASGSAIIDVRDRAASIFFKIVGPQGAGQLGGTTQFAMILDRGIMYMKFPPALSAQLPSLGGKQWLKFDLMKAAGLPGLSSLQGSSTMTDPSQMLQYLLAASNGVTNLGHQRVDGVETTHYRARLSLDRLGGNLPAAERSRIERSLSQLQQTTGVSEVPVDVWIDAHHLVRRIAMSLAMRAANGPLMQENATVDISNYGPQPRPTPPPADQVADIGSLIHIGG